MEEEYQKVFEKVDKLMEKHQMDELKEAYNLLMTTFRGVVPGIEDNLPNIYPENFGDWGHKLIYDPEKYYILPATVKNRAKEYLRKREIEEKRNEESNYIMLAKVTSEAKNNENDRIAEILTDRKLFHYRLFAIILLIIFILALISGAIFVAFYIIGKSNDTEFLKQLETFSLIYSVISIPFGLIAGAVGLAVKLALIDKRERVFVSIKKIIK
ncbi:MAG: hypothetical protein MJ227_04785 [Bacilli bacterium]|nr:hypothetical protein [Bacilli bacterium]